MKTLLALGCLFALLAGSALTAADKPDKKKEKENLTCCQAAALKNKECTHRCCLAAHRKGQSCEKCNPHKEDLKLKKDKKRDQKDEKPPKKPESTKEAAK